MADNKNSAARIRANNKYNAKAYDRIGIAVPKGRKAEIEAYAQAQGETINSLVNGLIRKEMNMTEDRWKRLSNAED